MIQGFLSLFWLENCLTYKQREDMLAIILAVWVFKQLLMRQSKLVFVEI
jgi:hypothetical protein